MKKKRRKKKKHSRDNFILGVVIAAVMAASGVGTYYYNYMKDWNTHIYPGVLVQGINLSGTTKGQAINLMKQKFSNDLNSKSIVIEADGKEYTMSYSKINPQYNIEDTVNQAFAYGKDSDPISKYRLIKEPKTVNYKLKVSYDTKPLQALINQVGSEVDRDAVNSTINLSNGFNVIPEKNGKKLDRSKLLKELEDELNKNEAQKIVIDAPIQETKARVTQETLKNINTKIGSFSTNFGSISSPQRANNITIAAKSIDGTLLLPGEIFSFNNVVGERTAQKGYEAAPVIIGDKLESGLGGGICQVSTTLYNATLSAGIPSVERTKHSMPVHYVAQGMDATVSYGSIDYKFKNTFNYPIYIQAYTSEGVVTFNLYSNSSIRK